MPLINSFLSWIMKKRIHQIELFIKYPHEVHGEWMKKLITTAKDTEFGKKFDFRSINTYETFRERLPILDYDQLNPYIIRLRQGEQNLLWPTDIRWFAKSSGTTCDRSKFIPVSQEALEDCHFKGGKDLMSVFCNNNPNTKVFTGKAVTLGGSHQVSEFSNESYYGDLSAIIIQNLPFWAEFMRSPNLNITLMDEWESKIEKMAMATMNQNVTNISGVPSWMLVLARRVLEIAGKDNLLEVWPNLEVFVHGGVAFTPYTEQYSRILPSSSVLYYQTYNASEGFFGLQDRNDADDMLLMLDYGIFYEFIPIEEIDKEKPRAIPLEDVVTNVNYAIVITTNAGLWRYMIGDTVRFTCLNPYRIVITGRTKSFINAFGEELIIDNAEKALAVACEKTHSSIRDYTAGPVYFGDSSNGAHEWLIEFDVRPENTEYFTEVLDNALKAINSDYEAKRYHNLALREPIIRVLEEGTFYNWMKKRGKLGGQHKVPRLANDRRYIEEILKD
ncbi:MAG: GH3 auxin-responsive promoter family protein [Bacteroidetes bacterium]|nr:GH3 auxin-responsive promoter family protein [Bacteroidota bacterium]MBU1718835.1 GH3 auxin-responsive promoter family protein [Bacteroidota bacterium]